MLYTFFMAQKKSKHKVVTNNLDSSRIKSAGTQKIIAIVAIILLGLIVYGRCVTYEYVLYDDPFIIFGNPDVMGGLSLKSIYLAFTKPTFGLYMPLPTITFMLDSTLFGEWAGGYHASTLFWHLLCVCVFYWVMLRLFKVFPVVLLATLLFCVHPVQAMTVNWIPARNEIMTAFFMLLSVDSYRRYAQKAFILPAERGVTIAPSDSCHKDQPSRSLLQTGGPLLLSLFFMLLGVCCKQGIVVLPVILLLLDYWPLKRIAFSFRPPPKTMKRVLFLSMEKIPWFVVSLIAVFFAYIGKSDFGAFEGDNLTSPLNNVDTAIAAYGRYIGHMLYPLRYMMAYGIMKPSHWNVFLVAAMLLVITITALCMIKKRPWLLLGWAWFVLFLLPVSGLVHFASEGIALRYLYTPGIGLYLMASFSLFYDGFQIKGKEDNPEQHECVNAPVRFWVVTVMIALIMAGLCFWQSGFWRNTQTLAQRALEVSAGKNGAAHNHLAMLDKKAGLFSQEFEHHRIAYENNPEVFKLKLNYAGALCNIGRYEESIRLVKPMLEESPDSLELLNLYGGVLIGLERLDEAVKPLEYATEIDPDYVDALANLALCHSLRGHPEQARTLVEHVLEKQPGHPAAKKMLESLKRKQGLTQANDQRE